MVKTVEILLNPTWFAEELASKLRDYKLLGIEVDAAVASHLKNIEALANAIHVVVKNAQAVAKRQAEILEDTMNQIAKSFEALAKADSPPEVVVKQAELAKEAFEKAFGNLHELTETVTKAQQAILETISGRISESLDEIKQTTLKMKQPAAEDKQPAAEDKQPAAEAGTPKS